MDRARPRLGPSVASTAVFSGAGLSGALPTGLPMGTWMRDELLRLMHTAANRVADDVVTSDSLDSLTRSSRKLELVLGRLWGVTGDDALVCLLSLRVAIPNEAHLLCALHLVLGGTHVTVNFDRGIETAHDLLTGRADLPPDAPGPLAELLPKWRALTSSRARLRVVASHDDFAAWNEEGQPPALLKVHGSLNSDQDGLVDVVVVDVEQLGLLSRPRRAAIDALGNIQELLITGYAGGDPDVYEPLLQAAQKTSAQWRSLALSAPVQADIAEHYIEVFVGAPQGLATTGLRELLPIPQDVRWLEVEAGNTAFDDLLTRWRSWFVARHAEEDLAAAWAWLCADLGELDTAVSLLGRLRERSDSPDLMLRNAEMLYTRAKGHDRDTARGLFWRLARSRNLDAGTRAHALIRIGDVARGEAIRDRARLPSISGLSIALAAPVAVLLRSIAGRRDRIDREVQADAFRAIQQTCLRALEQCAGAVPEVFWPALAAACSGATWFGNRAEGRAVNGNRRALVRQQRLLLLSLAAVLRRRAPASSVTDGLTALHNTYLNGDDLPGAGNCTAALALVAAAVGDQARSDDLLAKAWSEYSYDQEGHAPYPSGAALIGRIRRIISRLE
jgi:hypothetical protein